MTSPEKLLEDLNEELKGRVIVPKREVKIRHSSISTGVAVLDLKLRGGWPVGCLNLLYGHQSAGKSLLALLAIASAQRTCRRCYTIFSDTVKCECKKNDPCKALYIDAENYWTNEWANAVGIKDEDVILGQPRTMEEAFDIVDIFIRKEAVDLIVLDSIAGLVPKAERESTMEEWQTALVPRLFTKFLRKWAGDLAQLKSENRHLPATIFTNQIRQRTVAYGNPEILPGGTAQMYFSTTIVKVQRKGIEMSADKEDPQPMFQTVRFVLDKTKVSPVKVEGEFNIAINHYIDEKGEKHHPGQVENEKMLLGYARRFGVIDEKPGKYIFGDREFKNQDDIISSLKADVGFFRDLMKAVQKANAEYVPMATSLSRKKKNDEKSQEGEAETPAS